MSKNLKSLNSGVLKCGASQFKDNIPSIQRVTLAPATDNPVNFVIEITKDGAAAFNEAMSAASVPHYIEEYTEDNVLMNRIFAAIPEEPGFFIEAGMTLTSPANIYCYQSGVLPAAWLAEVLQSGTGGSNVYFINSVEMAEDSVLMNAYEATTVIFMKDTFLKASALNLGNSSTLIINGVATLELGSIAMKEYDPTEAENCNTTIILAAQPDDTHIAQGAIDGDIMNLYYNGEWNTTTRDWFHGSIFNLNETSLDPIPEE